MKITAVNVTWNQPVFLGRMIECFLRQSYPDRKLFILDDANQYPNQEGDRWKLVSQRVRYPTLGDKRNAALKLACECWPDTDAWCPFDTDDIYLPDHLQACVSALQWALWAQPRQVLIPGRRRFKRQETFRQAAPDNIGYHGAWAFRREVMLRYAVMNNGEDADLASRLRGICGPSADSSIITPTYSYNSHGTHLSSMGPDGYAKLGRQKIEPVTELDISWPEDYSKWPIDDEVLPRNW